RHDRPRGEERCRNAVSPREDDGREFHASARQSGVVVAVFRAAGTINRIIELIMVALLTGMALMVFVNVVLRYGFNTGIAISEEMSRFFFIWLTFIGAVVTFHEN